MGNLITLSDDLTLIPSDEGLVTLSCDEGYMITMTMEEVEALYFQLGVLLQEGDDAM